MKQNSDVFVFETFKISENRKVFDFFYRYKSHSFICKLILPKEIRSTVNPILLNKTLENLHIMLGISYFKMFCPKLIKIPYQLSREQALFWNTVYTKGLGEFFYRNKIDYRGLINFPYKENIKQKTIAESRKDRILLGIGGGKDSIVALEILKNEKKDFTGLILETGPSDIQQKVANIAGIEFLLIKRILDEKLFSLDKTYTGHVPFSAIYAFIGLLIAVIYDYNSIITANEKSSNFGNINYLGMEINHQWSKSEEFENLFNDYVSKNITSDIRYYSILRDKNEIDITKIFIKYKKYFSAFSSCNTNYKIQAKTKNKWCGKCAKCAFVFILLAAYLSKSEVIKIFNKNLLEDKNLITLYKDLLGKGNMKPFDCVGTFEESIQALTIIKSKGEFNDDIVLKQI